MPKRKKNPIERFVNRVARIARRVVGATRNALSLLLGRERKKIPVTREEPVGGEYRRTFYFREDAEAYASEIPIPTAVVVRVAEDELSDDDGFIYDVYIIYE